MTKRKRQDEIVSLFDLIIGALKREGTDLPPNVIKKLRAEFLPPESEAHTMAAKDFSLELAIQTFGLEYAAWGPAALWEIDDVPETKTFSPRPSLEPTLELYAKTVDRSSEAACRTPIDLLLFECIGELQGKSETTGDDRPTTPAPYKHLKLCCEVSFSHKLTGEATTINGLVNHGIGIVIASRRKVPNHLFHSLLLSVEAKYKDGAESALPQLVVYLGCLRQARKARGRSDCSVYGIASDGFFFTFVMITHEGVLRTSRTFNIRRGDLKTVMGCLVFILRKTADMSPTSKPEKIKGRVDETEEDTADVEFDLENNTFLHSADEDEDEYDLSL